MYRPSCCNNSCCNSSDGGLATGVIAFVAIAVIVGVIGPVLAEITKIVVEIVHLVVIAMIVALTGAALTGITVLILRHRASYRHLPQRSKTAVPASTLRAISPAHRPAIRPVHDFRCGACGGTGEIWWAAPNGQFISGRCTTCSPTAQAR